MSFKSAVRPLIPPLLWQGLQTLRAATVGSPQSFVFCPNGWNTKIDRSLSDDDRWRTYMYAERSALEALKQRLAQDAPLLRRPNEEGRADDSPSATAMDLGNEYLPFLTFAYVLSVAARKRDTLSVLDYGSGLGEYFWVARSVLPDVAIDYHCADHPGVAALGREVTPDATWHTGEAAFDGSYDLIMFSACLQYMPDWKSVIERAARATRRHLFLTQVSVILDGPGYVAMQRQQEYGVAMLNQQISREELLETVSKTGMRVVREFMMQDHPRIIGAPSQPVFRGWLFEHEGPA